MSSKTSTSPRAEPSALRWGRRFLLCPPDHFDVSYAINPWMERGVAVDRDRAHEQWTALRQTLEAAGATVDVLDPVPGLPDLVFTANAGLVTGEQFVPSHFRDRERQGETPVNVAWFEGAGYAVSRLPDAAVHEGAGDALPWFVGDRGRLVAGQGLRSEPPANRALAELLDVEVLGVDLTDPRFYHLDLTFCPLDERRTMIVPAAWDRVSAQAVAALVPEPLELSLDEALRFSANSVVVGDVVVMPECPPRVGRRLEAWGFTVEVVDVSEFRKAGGACRCLTLALDVDLRPGPDGSDGDGRVDRSGRNRG